MSCKKRVRHTGTTNRVDTRLDHSPAGALAHALQTLGCPAVIRSVSRSALAPKSGASTAKASQATRDAPHPAGGAREHSRCARDSVLPWVGRSMLPDFTRRAAGLLQSLHVTQSLARVMHGYVQAAWQAQVNACNSACNPNRTTTTPIGLLKCSPAPPI